MAEKRDYYEVLGVGKTATADWLLPVYYRGPNVFVTPFYGKSEDETKGYFDGMNYIAEKYVRLEK